MVNIGPNFDEAIETLKKLGPKHRYLISGYPPFLRMLFYFTTKNKLDLHRYHIDVLTGGEGFVEEWRDLIKQHLGPSALIFSAYGSTDKGLGEGIETPLTITIRNLYRILLDVVKVSSSTQRVSSKFLDSPFSIDIAGAISLFNNIFHINPAKESRIPMVFQTDPLTYFHQQIYKNRNGNNVQEVLTTNLKTYSSQAVIKYNIEDESGICGFDKMMNGFKSIGIDPIAFSKRLPHSDSRFLPFPFFFVFGRSTGMLSVDGANIFPEEIGRAIEHSEIGSLVNSFRIKLSPDYRFAIELE
ncbi:MAG: hypothetical protein ACD_28C00131G0001, partial [uncultured bacterium]